mmetsp:Transcript_85679/g.191515  ORF Transcript_85679/g.191515 Transcript_85679/m.191515 type:complete len:267 (-) Transcript_85679:661-1461(-)
MVKGEVRKRLRDGGVVAVVNLIHEASVGVQLYKMAFHPIFAAEMVALLVGANRGVEGALEEAQLRLRHLAEDARIVGRDGRAPAESRVCVEASVLLEILKETLCAHHVLVGRIRTLVQDHAVDEPHAALHEGLMAKEDTLHCRAPSECLAIELEGCLGGGEVLPQCLVLGILEDQVRCRQLELDVARSLACCSALCHSGSTVTAERGSRSSRTATGSSILTVVILRVLVLEVLVDGGWHTAVTTGGTALHCGGRRLLPVVDVRRIR